MSRTAIGSRAQVVFVEESTWGETPTVPLAGLYRAIEMRSEGITNAIGNLVSQALRPDRTRGKRVRGVNSVGGPIVIEQNPEGQVSLYHQTLGRYISVSDSDGGIRAQLDAAEPSGETSIAIRALTVNQLAAWPATGSVTAIYEDANGDLAQETKAYTVVAKTSFTVSAIGADWPKGTWLIFTKTGLDVVPWTHYIEGNKTLPPGVTCEIGRDIVFFTYRGSKVNTLEETFNPQEILTGTFNFLAKDEFCGTFLTADATNTPTLSVNEADRFSNLFGDGTTHELGIGIEQDLAYSRTNVNDSADTITLDATFSGLHISGEAVYPMTGAVIGVGQDAQYASTDPFSGFEAALFLDGAALQVLSATYTLNNNLFPDKFHLGSRDRAELPEQARTTEGSINVQFRDHVLYTRYVRGLAGQLEIRCISDEGLINPNDVVADQVPHQKHIIFPKIEFNGNTPTASDENIITHDMPFTALADDDYDKPEIVMFFVNSESSVSTIAQG